MMENKSKENSKEDAVDITKIYEIIRDKTFTQDLWLDVMSDLKQKVNRCLYISMLCL